MIPPALLEKAIAKGSDTDFQEYVKGFPCVFNDMYDRVHNGVPRSVYSHINRVSRGSGMGRKTPYSGIPTLHEVELYLHKHGECKNLREHLDRESINMLVNWVNGKKPQEYELFKKRKGRTYEPDCPEMYDIISFGAKRRWKDGNKRLLRVQFSNANKQRTIKQNKSQWFLYQQIQDHANKKPSILGNLSLEYANHLVVNQLNKDMILAIHEMLKTICNKGYSTTLLTTDTWGEEYAHEIIHLAREKLGIELTMPVRQDGLEQFESRFK